MQSLKDFLSVMCVPSFAGTIQFTLLRSLDFEIGNPVVGKLLDIKDWNEKYLAMQEDSVKAGRITSAAMYFLHFQVCRLDPTVNAVKSHS